MSNACSQNGDTRKDALATNTCYIFPKARDSMEIRLPTIEMPKFKGVDDDRIKLACYEHAETLWFPDKGFIKKMIVTSRTQSTALHYTLESFEKNEEKVIKIKPYRGEYIDSPENGSPRNSSSIGIDIDEIQVFEDGTSSSEIPGSRCVKVCSECDGGGVQLCSVCKGEESPCDQCESPGRSSAKCNKCQGHRKLLHYEELLTTRKRHINDAVHVVPRLPVHLIEEAPGTQLYVEENPMISPLSHSPCESINEASLKLFTKHRKLSRSESFLMQRQTLRAVPVTLVKYTSKGKEGEFFVYGCNNQVYFQNYPRKYCYIM